MAFKLKDLALPEAKLNERMVWVNFKGCEFQIRYISKATLQAIAESCKVAVFDPKKGGRSVTLEPDKFVAGLANAIVKNWNKVTPRTLTTLYPMDLSGLSEEEKDKPIEFNSDNLLEVLLKANSLDDFLQECATEAGLFRIEAEKSLEKNSSTSQSIT